MGRHEQGTAAVAQPRSNRGNTHHTLREHFTLFQTLSSLIYFSVEVSSSNLKKYLCKTVCYSSSEAGLRLQCILLKRAEIYLKNLSVIL